MDTNQAIQAPARCCPPPPRPGPDGLRRFAALFKALGDPTRLEMLELMARANGSLCVCDVESCFDLSQPTISHHLGLLRKAGLVLAERRGTWMHYTISPTALEQLKQCCRELEPNQKNQEESCRTQTSEKS